MLVKASSITNLTDARYFAAKEVDFLGFNLEENTEGYLDPLYMKAIREWVQGPKIVGEFNRSSAAVVREAAEFFGLDAVQVSNPDNLQFLVGLEVILHLPGTRAPEFLEQILDANAAHATYFLLDFSRPNLSGVLLGEMVESWQALFARYPVLVDINMPVEEMSLLLKTLQPSGLALKGGEEERVGIKSFDEIDAIFEALL